MIKDTPCSRDILIASLIIYCYSVYSFRTRILSSLNSKLYLLLFPSEFFTYLTAFRTCSSLVTSRCRTCSRLEHADFNSLAPPSSGNRQPANTVSPRVSRRFANSCPKPESQPTKHIPTFTTRFYRHTFLKNSSKAVVGCTTTENTIGGLNEKYINPPKKKFIQGIVVVFYWFQCSFDLVGPLPIISVLSRWYSYLGYKYSYIPSYFGY